MGTIENIESSDEIKVLSMTLTLSGINKAIREYVAKVQPYAQKKITIYTAYLDENHAVIGTPVVEFQGKIESMAMDIGGPSTVTVSVVNDLADWDIPQEGRYTNTDQQSNVDSTDTGLSHLTDAVSKFKGTTQVDWRFP